MRDQCRRVEPYLSAWLDGELDGEARVRVRTHVGVCDRCREQLADLRWVRASVQALPVRRMPERVRSGGLTWPARPHTPASRPARSQPPAPQPARSQTPAPQPARLPQKGRAVRRVGASLAVALGVVGGAAYALGDVPPPGARAVAVPLDVYVADHLVHVVDGPVATPVIAEPGR